MALVCCMTFSMGSSYVNAGEPGSAVAESETIPESGEAEEFVPAQTKGADNQGAVQNVGGEADNDASSDSSENGNPDDGNGEQAGGSKPVMGGDSAADEPDAGESRTEPGTETSNAGDSSTQPRTETSEAGDSSTEPGMETSEAGESGTESGTETPGAGDSSAESRTETSEAEESRTETSEAESGDMGTNIGGGEGMQEDFSDLPSIEELTANPEDAVGATMFRALISGPGSTDDNGYDFSAYYVNQSNGYDVTMENDFNLKYQMEFHASENFGKGAVVIKINAGLFKDRDENLVTPTEIGIPKGTMENPVSNRSTPFNYYYEDDGETLVFFNYKAIVSGTNAAWQVLYRDQKLMNIVDETEWELIPQISVTGMDGSFRAVDELTGRIDSWVELESVDKSYYTESGLNYTPGLYTLSQVQEYISGGVDEKFLNKEGRLDTAKWHFVVWDVKVKGTATQPWDMVIKDTPGNEGVVVGYKDNSDKKTAYDLPVETTDIGMPGSKEEVLNALKGRKEESWGNRFYVVTAYPAELTPDGETVSNDITVELVPVDKKDDNSVIKSQTATWKYEDYDWTYSGNIIGVEKKTDNTVYTGWLDAYRQSVLSGKDYGDMPFNTTGHMYGYSYTHRVVDGSEEGFDYITGDYIPDTYYTLTTVDDFMYLYSGSGDGQIMDGDDYCFSGVTITQTDYGYDVWEDKKVSSELTEAKPDSLPDVFKQGGEIRSEVRIYAMLANPEGKEAKDEWMLIDTVYMDAEGRMDPYVFSEEIIKQEPWRVKVEHDTIDYETVCKIDVQVRIQSGSDKMSTILDERKDAETNEKSPEVKFENVSGVLGQVHTGGTISYLTETDGEHGSANYSEPGLQEATKALYQDTEGNGMLLVRDNAYRTVTWLNETAASFKNARSTNDVDNNRVLVDYYLTAYDGYEIYNRDSLNYLREEDQQLISPGRNHVVFYDLLPYGMRFDASAPITAGRITDLSRETYQTQPKSWDGTQVTVTVDPEQDIITNYRGTGRTMVAFHIAFSGADATSYTNRKWIEGWGVSFRAYYDWKDIDQLNKVDINANLSAFMPDFSERSGGSNMSHPALVGLKSEVNYDNGTHGDSSADIDKAYADMVKAYRDENGTVGPGNIDGQNLTDNEGNSLDSTYRNVLYAKNVLKDDVATASESKIEKLVRADSDRFGTFDRSAVVPVGEGRDGFYTYDITVTTATGIKDIVIFDRLERAAVDRRGTSDPFAGEFKEGLITWSGAFQFLDTTALDKQGIACTAYYSENADAVISQNNEDPANILTAGNGWFTKNEFKEMIGKEHSESAGAWQNYVKAVAVRLDEKDQKPYQLEAGSSVSFQIKMKAPQIREMAENSSLVTYNNPSFSSVAVNTTDRSTVTGNSVKVTISNEERLEIIKKTSGTVPAVREDENFEFRLHEEYQYGGETVKQYLAYKEYKLYKLSGNDNWVLQDGLHATDGNGYLYLHAGEKAVFEVADAGRIQVEETENVFWESEIAQQTTESAADGTTIRTLTVTNTWRPVLYMRKNLSAVPEDVDVKDASFTFRAEIKRNGSYVPLANAEFWYVDSVRLDGGIPGKISSGVTGEDGTFTIGKDDIVALFPGVAGTEYRVSEVTGGEGDEETESTWDWVCELDHVTGTMAAGGDSRSITNYYRWKELLLTKDITHQSQEDYDQAPQPFTFSISEVGKDENGEEILTPVAGKEWELLGDPVSGNTGTIGEVGNENTGTAGEAGNGNDGAENGSVSHEETYQTSGVLDENGQFTCAMGFRTVRIKGLEAGKTYRIVELTEGIGTENGKPLYVPADDGSMTTTMPVYSTRRDVTVANDYQKRPLSVKKTVAGADDDGEPEDEEKTIFFRFEATVNGKPILKGTPYTVERTGSAETVTRFVGVMPEGEDYSFAQAGVTLGENQFVLADGETALFKDAGMIDDGVVVTEVDNTTQIYPADKGAYQDTFSEEGAEASFVNGEPGSLLIGKTYVGLDEIGNAAVDDLRASKKTGSTISVWNKDTKLSWGYGDKETVEVVLEITDEEGTYIWPEVPVTVQSINHEGQIQVKTFEPGDSITLNPFETIIIPTGEGTGIPLDASYILTETEESRKRIVQYVSSNNETYWLQVSQSAASDGLAKPETISARPSAVICNEVKSIGNKEDGSKRGKMMTSTSDEVPEGKKLVWRVERYDQASGAWVPAQGIDYVIFNGEEVVSREVESTKEDGLITLYKLKDNGMPTVWFPKDLVYLNLYSLNDIQKLFAGTEEGKALLRLVEVPEESDDEWGMLVAYQGVKQAGSGILRNKSVQQRGLGETTDLGNDENLYGMDVSPEYAMYFVNSNGKTAVEIEKYVKAGSDSLFTMILEQVISTSLDEITKDNYQNAITATRPGAGIPYIVYNADGGAVGSGVTGSGGELQLEAGQYVSLEVPYNTRWLVSEKTSASPNYSLADLQPESGDGRLTKLDDNLMLINLPANMIPVQYTVEWYAGTELLHRETRVGNVGDRVSVSEADKSYGAEKGYVFDEDSLNGNVLAGTLDVKYPTVLRLQFVRQPMEYTIKVIRKYLMYSGEKWESREIATVKGAQLKVQGVPGQTFSAAEVVALHENGAEWNWRSIDSKEVEFRLSKDSASVTFSEATNEYTITLIYERKAYEVRYVDGVAGVTVFPDEGRADCLEGDLPPAYEEDTPEREGYDFVGWSPDVNKAISHENARYYEGEGWVIEYQAQWKEKQ